MITAHGNESLAATALRRGADDYLAKDASLRRCCPRCWSGSAGPGSSARRSAAAERDLLRAERLAAIGEMTVTLHHEINNPLMSAFADVELLLADPATARSKRWAGLQEVQHRPAPDQGHRTPDRRPAGDPHQELRGGRADGGPGRSRPDRAGADLGRALVLLADEGIARVVLLLGHAGFAAERCATTEDLCSSRPGRRRGPGASARRRRRRRRASARRIRSSRRSGIIAWSPWSRAMATRRGARARTGSSSCPSIRGASPRTWSIWPGG